MGLGIYIQATRPGRWWTRLFTGSVDLAEQLAMQLLSEINDPTLRQIAAVHPAENGVDIQLHPAAECLELRNTGRNACVCSIKTSTCGPGFHAYVVELLQGAGDKLEIQWTLDGDYADETEFWTHRSFDRLQCEMATLLFQLARSIAEHVGDYENLMINMRIGFPLLADGGKQTVLTPLGP